MIITVYIYPNARRLQQMPDGSDEILPNNNSRLSTEEFDARLREFTAKFTELVGPDVPPLSDYAMSREGIYEDHP